MDTTKAAGKSFMIDDILGSKTENANKNKKMSILSSLASSPVSEPVQRPAMSSPTSSSAALTTTSLLPSWIFCTRYSDRPSSGSRRSRSRKHQQKSNPDSSSGEETTKRPRTAYTKEQVSKLHTEFRANPYLTEARRASLAGDIGINEEQVKIWFQNKRAKVKKSLKKKKTWSE